MSINRFHLLVLLFVVIIISVSGCSNNAGVFLADPDPQSTPLPLFTATQSVTPFQPATNTPLVVPPTFTPSLTFTPSPTDTPIPTDTPVPSFTPTMTWNPAGLVIAPILLYHHIGDVGYSNRYYVSPDTFREQMQALHDWGYSTITPSDLVNVLINGGELPSRPVVITFDDGNLDVYQNAFPIMQEMGFVGAFYIVANRLESNGYVNVGQLQEMAAAGWEIGSHGMSHIDLTIDYSVERLEVLQSRLTLEDAIGVPVKTFAYPFGLADSFVYEKVSEYGYRAGMGLGSSYQHTLGTLFYLSRREVHGDYNLTNFAALLPWSGN
jgi:peptidoglycan/xylan/chitin deacetylase (PgdA/CDA1 family)